MSPKGLAVLKKAAATVKLPKGKHWLASILGDPTLLFKHKPAAGKVVVDNLKGRYHVEYPTKGKKSFAWTERGNMQATKLALECLWRWDSEYRSAPVPANVQELLDQDP